MKEFIFKEPYMSFDEQVERRKEEIRNLVCVVNKDWAIEQINKNPYVEFDMWFVGDFYNEVFKRDADRCDIDYGTYYFLVIRGSEKPKFIVNGEEW